MSEQACERCGSQKLHWVWVELGKIRRKLVCSECEHVQEWSET